MFSRFFIYRPIFASVIAIVIVLVGTLAIPLLPIESMPNITPPSVQVTTSYPGFWQVWFPMIFIQTSLLSAMMRVNLMS